jgi:hypothetical protein
VEVFYAATEQTNTGLLYYGTLNVSNAPITESYSNDMRLVTATVKWTSAKVVRQRSMTTLIARYGLQNYIY